MTQVLTNSPAAWTARAASPCPLAAVGWTEQGQADRFAAVLAALDPRPGESLLDFGCGTGALSEHVSSDVGYTGVDWAAGMVKRAAREHPGRAFRNVKPEMPFDLIAVVGAFNLPDGWSKSMTWEMLRMLWDDCGRALAACLYAGTDERCIRYDAGQVVSFARSTARLWRVEQHRPNDLLLVMRR